MRFWNLKRWRMTYLNRESPYLCRIESRKVEENSSGGDGCRAAKPTKRSKQTKFKGQRDVWNVYCNCWYYSLLERQIHLLVLKHSTLNANLTTKSTFQNITFIIQQMLNCKNKLTKCSNQHNNTIKEDYMLGNIREALYTGRTHVATHAITNER